ncbi:MAG: CARDB domain-containing protein [Candidatus Electrothrix gigas]
MRLLANILFLLLVFVHTVDAKLVSETIRDDSYIFTNEKFIKKWRVRNDTDRTWTKDYTFSFDDTNGSVSKLVSEDNSSFSLPRSVAPGEEFEFIRNMKAPSSEGIVEEQWRLLDENQSPVFRLVVKVKVVSCPISNEFSLPVGFVESITTPAYHVSWDFLDPCYNLPSEGYHHGEDWNSRNGGDNDLGDPVYAIGHGVVVYVSMSSSFSVVLIRHVFQVGNEHEVVYAKYLHMTSSKVNESDIVYRGQQIGTIGKIGAKSSHLHFELIKNELLTVEKYNEYLQLEGKTPTSTDTPPSYKQIATNWLFGPEREIEKKFLLETRYNPSDQQYNIDTVNNHFTTASCSNEETPHKHNWNIGAFNHENHDYIVDNGTASPDYSATGFSATGNAWAENINQSYHYIYFPSKWGGVEHSAQWSWNPTVTDEYDIFVGFWSFSDNPQKLTYIISVGDKKYPVSINQRFDERNGVWVQKRLGRYKVTSGTPVTVSLSFNKENAEFHAGANIDQVMFKRLANVADLSTENHPDLQVEASIVDNKFNLTPSKPFKISATVSNQGDGPSEKTTLHYYRSEDATITTSDTELGTEKVASILAGATSDEYIYDSTAPEAPDEYWIGACVKAVDGESDTKNNCSTGVKITVTADKLPDLVLIDNNLQVKSIPEVEGLDYYTFSCTFKNEGADIPQDVNIEMSFFINDDEFQKTPLNGFTSGTTHRFEYKYSINENSPARIYALCKIDPQDKVVESNEENNWVIVKSIKINKDTTTVPPQEYPVPTSQDDIKAGDRIFAQCDITLFDCETLAEKGIVKFSEKDLPSGDVIEILENLKGSNEEWLKVQWEGYSDAFCSRRSTCPTDGRNNVRNACYFKDYAKAEVTSEYVNCRPNVDKGTPVKIKQGSTGYSTESRTTNANDLTYYNVVWDSCTKLNGAACPSSCWAAEYDHNGNQLLLISGSLAHKESIYELCKLGVVDGFNNGKENLFKPYDSLTRAQLSKIIVNTMKKIPEYDVKKNSENNQATYKKEAYKFCDVDESEGLAAYIGELTLTGVVHGYGKYTGENKTLLELQAKCNKENPENKGLFGPLKNVKHGELAKFIVNAILVDQNSKSWKKMLNQYPGTNIDNWTSISKFDEDSGCSMPCPQIFSDGKSIDIQNSVKQYYFCPYLFKLENMALPFFDEKTNSFVNVSTKEEDKPYSSEGKATRGETMKAIYSSFLKRTQMSCDLLECGKSYAESCIQN